jgi:hypothetical protein
MFRMCPSAIRQPGSWCNRLWVLKNSSPRNSQKIKSRQDAIQTIFSGRLDIAALLLLWANQVAHRRHIGGVAGKCQAA